MMTENIEACQPPTETADARRITAQNSRWHPWLLGFALVLCAGFGYTALSMAQDILAVMQALTPNW